MASPADAQEPGARRRDAGRFSRRHRLGPAAPALEPSCRRGFVQPNRRRGAGALLPVLPDIEKDVRQRVPHFARSPQRADVVATEKHRPRAPEDAVRRPCDAGRDGFHPARECSLVLGFDEKMQVIALDRELRDAEVATLARHSEAALDLGYEGSASERRNITLRAQRDVRRAAPRQHLASHVVHDRPAAARATGARARPTAPCAATMVVEGELRRSHRA